MNEILNAGDFYHTGIVVEDLDKGIAELTAVGGYEWTKTLELSVPVRTDAGEAVVDVQLAYTLQAPHLELVQEIPGTVWTSAPRNAVHHLGFFVDDLAGKSAELERAGFRRELCATAADGQAPAIFAYHIDPLGMRIEIVDRLALGDFRQYLEENRR